MKISPLIVRIGELGKYWPKAPVQYTGPGFNKLSHWHIPKWAIPDFSLGLVSVKTGLKSIIVVLLGYWGNRDANVINLP